MKTTTKIATIFCLLFVSSQMYAAAPKYLYFLFSDLNTEDAPQVRKMRLTNTIYKKIRSYNTFTCQYETAEGSFEFTMGSLCGEPASLELRVSLNGTKAEASTSSLYTNHRAIASNVSLSLGAEYASVMIMSATKYKKLRRLAPGFPTTKNVKVMTLKTYENFNAFDPKSGIDCMLNLMEAQCED